MKVEYIAEFGKNQITKEDITIKESLENAKKLVLAAKEAGANTGKWQCHVFEDEKNKRSEKRHEWIKKNELLTSYWDFWKPLKDFQESAGLNFLVTPMSKKAAIKVGNFVSKWKVGSADIVDFELLEYLKSTGKPIIISTGMSTKEQIERAVYFLGNQIQIIMYCISIYPTPIYKINLTNLVKLSGRYKIPVGFSDHSLSVEVPALAVRMGAVAIEKHFTLDRNNWGPDHKVSLLPEEFKQMVNLCKLAETEYESFEEEKEHWRNFRKNES